MKAMIAATVGALVAVAPFAATAQKNDIEKSGIIKLDKKDKTYGVWRTKRDTNRDRTEFS